MRVERFLNLRYDGTDVAIMTACARGSTYSRAFEDTYRREFGFTLEERRIMVPPPHDHLALRLHVGELLKLLGAFLHQAGV